MQQLANRIKQWGEALGFQQIGFTDTNLTEYEPQVKQWLAKGFHGSMQYMEKHGTKRYRPALLIPDTIRIISVRMNYLPADTALIQVLNNPKKGYISRYALGRDYHRLLRKRLNTLAKKISQEVSTLG